MPSAIKTVVVHGATGRQGGSVVRALSAAGYSVRAAVRDASAMKARELAAIPNVGLVTVNIDDAKTLVEAYTGADAVFSVTVPGPQEEAQGKKMADAAKTAGVRHFVWSALESTAKETNGAYVIPYFEAKDAITEYIASIGLPATYLYTPIFFENLVYFGFSRYITEEDTIEITCGGVADANKKLPYARIEIDLGEALKIVLTHSDVFLGKKIILAPHWQSLKEQAEIVAKVSGRKTRVGPPVEFPSDEHSQDIARMWNYASEYGLYRGKEYPDPLLEKYGFKPASFESFIREMLLPHLELA